MRTNTVFRAEWSSERGKAATVTRQGTEPAMSIARHVARI